MADDQQNVCEFPWPRRGDQPVSLMGTPECLPGEGGLKMITRGYQGTALLLWILAAVVGFAAEGPVPLSKAVEIRQLSPEEAQRGRIVRLRGTVTFVSQSGSDFLQDETAGTFFASNKSNVQPGDFVEIIGPTRMGRYIPGIGRAECRILGRGQLPVAVEADYDDLVASRYHYQRVAIEGVVRSQALEGGRTRVRVAMGGRIVEVLMESGPPLEPTFVDSRIRVEGLAAGSINDRRQLVQPFLRIPDVSGIRVIEPAQPEDQVPRSYASELLTFRLTGQGEHRVRVEGVVTACFRKTVFLRQDQTAFAVHFSAASVVSVGDRIAVLGFPQLERSSASLADAKIAARQPGPSPLPADLSIGQLLNGFHDFELVAVKAMVTDSFRDEDATILTLQNDGRAIQARIQAPETNTLVGSLVQVIGICQIESSVMRDDYRMLPKTVTLLVRAPGDVAVLKAPQWWTVRRLTITLGILGALVLVAGLWILALRWQVARRTAALRQRTVAEGALQERQRIARDFHDTLEQELAGLAIRLDAAATRAFDDKGRDLIVRSRNLVTRIQSETRNLISDLRTSSEDLGNLAAALQEVARRNSEHLPVHLQFPEAVPRLPATTVHQLRMITSECVTNVLKHARATAVTIRLDLEQQHLSLTIADNGCGYDGPVETRVQAGHFGCIGIRERCRNLGAEVTWSSKLGEGTTVRIGLALSAHPPGPLLDRMTTATA